MNLHNHFEIGKSGIKSPDIRDLDLLEQVAKGNLGRLNCGSCGHKGQSSDGLSNGRLRLKCPGCNKTCYAYKHSVVVALSRLPSKGIQVEPESQGRVVTGAPPTQFINKNINLNKINLLKKDTDRSENSSTADELTDMENVIRAETTDYCLAQVESLTDTVEDLVNECKSDRQMIVQIQSTLTMILRRIELLSAVPVLQHQQPATQAAMAEQPTSNERNNVKPGVLQTPWSTVAKNSRHVFSQKQVLAVSRNQPSSAKNIRSQNRYNELPNETLVLSHHSASESPSPQQPTLPLKGSLVRRELTTDQINNIKKGFSSKIFSPMVTLHFSGIKRNRIFEVKALMHNCGIELKWIRNISFIGRSILELISYADKQAIIVDSLAKFEISFIPDFNPLDSTNIKDEKKIHGMTPEEKQALSEKLFRKRLEHTLARLPKAAVHNRMRNYLQMKLLQDPILSAQGTQTTTAQTIAHSPSHTDINQLPQDCTPLVSPTPNFPSSGISGSTVLPNQPLIVSLSKDPMSHDDLSSAETTYADATDTHDVSMSSEEDDDIYIQRTKDDMKRRMVRHESSSSGTEKDMQSEEETQQ